jgi:glutathione S-transferase
MKLYYAPGACSLSPHIVAMEAGIPLDLEKVDLKTHQTEHGENYLAVNPKGYVPALRLDDGSVLTEGPAIVQYLADQKVETKLAPAAGSIERYHVMEWLTFINGEIHKAFAPLFGNGPDEAKQEARSKVKKRFDYVEKQLAGREFLVGENFTVADAYLFVMLTWANHMGIDLNHYPSISAFFDHVSRRPAVRATLESEGLKKAA